MSGGTSKLEPDRVQKVVEALATLPPAVARKVRSALYWIREPRQLMMEGHRSDVLRVYAGYWNAFECLVEAVCLLRPQPKVGKAEKQAGIEAFVAERKGKLDTTAISECYKAFVDPGFVALGQMPASLYRFEANNILPSYAPPTLNPQLDLFLQLRYTAGHGKNSDVILRRRFMSSNEDWAIAIRCADLLRRGHHRAESSDAPMLLTQRITRNPILCGGPTEYFSDEMPVWHPKTPDEDNLQPIDVLYGHYDPTDRSIEIFVNRIRQDASTFGAEPNELCEVVRIHEHAHAVAHLGSRFDDVHDHLSAFGQGKRTDWSEFLEQRTSWFGRFPSELHEFLAQGITYAALQNLSVPRRSERLRAVFEALEFKQPSHYRLTPTARQYADKADWTLILDAVRGTTDAYREPDFLLSAGIEALVRDTAR